MNDDQHKALHNITERLFSTDKETREKAMAEVSLRGKATPTKFFKKFVFYQEKVMPFDFVEWQYREYLRDRDIVIVGGADNFDHSVKNRRLHDGTIIVHINGHWARRGRCWPVDVIYHTVTSTPRMTIDHFPDSTWLQFAFLNLVDTEYEYGQVNTPHWATIMRYYLSTFETGRRTQIGHFTQGEWERENPYGRQYEWLNHLHKKYNTKLFTGLVALAHVLMQPCASVFVCGMDMFLDKSNGKPDAQIESHPLRGNLDFLYDCTKKYPNLTLDEPLKKALTEYGYSV